MNFGQKLALFILITLTVVYVYFALFNKRFVNILTIALRFARFTYTFQS